MDNVRKYNLMPEEIFSEQNRMADDRTLAKVLFYDIVTQLQVSAGISSVDTATATTALLTQSFPLSFYLWGYQIKL